MVLLVADDAGGLVLRAGTQLVDGQLGTVPVRLDDPGRGDAEARPDQTSGAVMASIVLSSCHVRHHAGQY